MKPRDRFHYRIFGQPLASRIELPGLPLGEPDKAALTVDCRTIDTLGPPDPDDAACYRWQDDRLTLTIEPIARYTIRTGRHIEIEACRDADPASVRHFLLGPALGALFQQRRALVLHAAAVELDGRALILAGHVGQGKSTLAAALIRHMNARLITDELGVIGFERDEPRGEPLLHAGWPSLQLWPEALRALGQNPTGTHLPSAPDSTDSPLASIRPGHALRVLPVERFHAAAIRPERIYLLHGGDRDDETTLEPLAGAAGLRALLEYLYRPEYLDPSAHAHQFGQLGRLARVCPLRRLRQRRDRARLRDTLDRIATDLAG